MTVGVQTWDTDGQYRRLFVEIVVFLVIILGLTTFWMFTDTPAELVVTYASFRGSLSHFGSKYGRSGLLKCTTAAARMFDIHEIVRDCVLDSTTFADLVISKYPKANKSALYDFWIELQSSYHRIPRTINNHFDVPGMIDPYASCFAAPDHLITGHAKYCITLAYELLPKMCSTIRGFARALWSERSQWRWTSVPKSGIFKGLPLIVYRRTCSGAYPSGSKTSDCKVEPNSSKHEGYESMSGKRLASSLSFRIVFINNQPP